jgi:hypothetical protein
MIHMNIAVATGISLKEPQTIDMQMLVLDLRWRHAARQFQTTDIFSSPVEQGLMLEKEHGNCTYLNQLYVRNLLVVSV